MATNESETRFNALPVASLGLQLDNEVVRITVGSALVCQSVISTDAPLQGEIDERGSDTFCLSMACHPCHGVVKDAIKRSLEIAQIPPHIELTDIYRLDGRHLDWAFIAP